MAEYLFERVSIENLLKPKNITGWKSLLKETFKQGGIEASEEMFTEIANILSDAAIMGANSNFATAVTNYMKDGLSREKAEQKAYLDCIAQVNWAGVGGFLSGVAMGGTKGAYEFGQYSKAQQNLEVVTRELQDVQKRRSHEAEGDGVDRSASEQTAADIFSGLPSNASEGTIDNIKTSRGGTEHGESRKESKVDFQRRSHSEGYSVYERGQNSFGYRRAQGQFASQNARQVQKELKTLGIDADIIVGSILRNRDGVTLGLDVSQAATLNAERIFINSDANLPPRNIAGHEAFHFWKSKAGRSAYIQAIEDNLLFKSEAFLEYQAIIAEAYLGEDVDLNDQRQIDALFEELFAYISGDIHEGVNDELLRPMFRDYEAVKRAWQDFVELQRGDNIVNTDVVETLVSSNGDGTLNSVVEIGGRFLQGPDAPSDRVALMNQAAQSGFGPMGQPALTTIYDRDMAAEIDPARAHLAFSQGYNAVIQGRKLPALPGGIPADIPPGLHGLYRLAQEMATKPQPREIPQRPVQQSPQEILTQLAREMATGPRSPLDDLSNEDIRAMLEEIAAGNEGLQSDASGGTIEEISEAEQTALLQYKSSESYKINSLLRDGRAPSEAERRLIEELDAVLPKLPTYQGRVYRRLEFDGIAGGQEALDAFLAEHQPGSVISYDAFTSSSTAEDGYPVKGDLIVTLIIESQTGRNMDGFGNNNEKEVLFSRGSNFFVERVEATDKGKVIIYMVEVPEDGE